MKKEYCPLIIKIRVFDDVDMIRTSFNFDEDEGGGTLPPWFLGGWSGA